MKEKEPNWGFLLLIATGIITILLAVIVGTVFKIKLDTREAKMKAAAIVVIVWFVSFCISAIKVSGRRYDEIEQISKTARKNQDRIGRNDKNQ